MNLFPSTLIVAKNKNIIDAKIGQFCADLNQNFDQNNPDILMIDQKSGWGIDQIRKINNFLSQKPFSHQSKAIIIIDAQNLNLEAQNALLKILEEPGKDNYIILTTSKIKSILPTIISRCQTIKMVRDIHESPQLQKTIDVTNNLIKDLALSEKLGKNKEDILPLLEDQLYFYQQELIKNPNQKTSNLIEKIIKAIQMVNANVDPRNALDYIFLA